MSPFDSFCNDGDDRLHQSPPTRPSHGDDSRSQNGCHLNEKEKREKETRNQIINEGNHRVELSEEKKSQKEGDKHYWRAIAELIPSEDNPSSIVADGTQPEKPINLARMRQMSLRLRQSLLPHLMLSPPKDPKDEADHGDRA